MKSHWACAAFLTAVIAIAGCGGGGSSGSSSGGNGGGPIPVVSPTGSPAAYDEAAFACPTSDTVASSARARMSAALARRLPAHVSLGSRTVAAPATALLAVSYDRSVLSSSRRTLATAELKLGAKLRREVDFPRIGLTTRVLAVSAASVAHVEAMIRARPGVHSVGLTGTRRYPLAVSAPYFTNDPYFVGFPNPQPTRGVTPPSTYKVLPYVENADVPGQWGLHAARFENALEYSQAGNGSNVVNANALGSTNVKMAIIDSGADTSQPDLGPNIVYQRCFITDPTDVQSTSNFVTDPDGHGTAVSGIGDAVSNNGFGFTGAGGRSSLYEYRIDPTPDSSCSPGQGTDDPQCSARSEDVVSAINDAVSRNVGVISMSLGALASDGKSSGCSSGADLDALEGNAVANALASNIVVVAAAGNDALNVLEAPACDQGVIAVGASALADGQLNGAKNSNGSAVAPIEYVASYSDYGSPGATFRSASAWGIVAPGGDPVDSDPDLLHWILNLYTSTPVDASLQACGTDYPGNVSTPVSCQILIAGTSMSAPELAGAAALILAVNPGYAVSPRMKQLLCSTTDEINDSREGCGRLNIYRAMAVALGDTLPP